MARIARYEYQGSTAYGFVEGDRIRRADGELSELMPSEEFVPLAAARLLSPTVPSKIIAIGPNYRGHFAEGGEPPSRPLLWSKPTSCRNDPEGKVELPPGHIVNHEVELCIVIGRTARCVPVESAERHILGYTCANDVTAGDFQTPGAFGASHYYVDGKIFDGFAPMGPWIETDIDPSDLLVQCRVNGEVRQRARTSDFLFSPALLVSIISDVLTLHPGDVILTGSPPGVGPVAPGDVVEVDIDGIGILRNHMCARA